MQYGEMFVRPFHIIHKWIRDHIQYIVLDEVNYLPHSTTLDELKLRDGYYNPHFTGCMFMYQ